MRTPYNFCRRFTKLGKRTAEESKQYLALNPKYDKLLTSLRTAYAEELNLEKEATSYDDLFDALRLALKGFEFK
jgi:hypothetical protein